MANTLNLDRSQRLDIICKRGDTFKMNLELKDDEGENINLNGTAPGASTSDPYYAFKMEVRAADTDDVVGDAEDGGYKLQKFATIPGRNSSSEPGDTTNLAEFKIEHGEMGIDTSTSENDNNLNAGVYVYDIEKRLYNTSPSVTSPETFEEALHAATPDHVETILYGSFTVNEDVTL